MLREYEGMLVLPAEISDNPPPAAEGAIERSIAVVPGEREVHGPASGRDSRHHDLPVGLNGERERSVVSAEVGDDPASAPEREIHASIGLVAGEGEVSDANGRRGPAVGVHLAAFPDVLSPSGASPPFTCGHELAVTL